MADRLALFSGRSDKMVIFYVIRTGNCQKSCGFLGLDIKNGRIMYTITGHHQQCDGFKDFFAGFPRVYFQIYIINSYYNQLSVLVHLPFECFRTAICLFKHFVNELVLLNLQFFYFLRYSCISSLTAALVCFRIFA